jgi:predicted RNA-binding Zn-ribbon protein involved in translation (DUF1610 family)
MKAKEEMQLCEQCGCSIDDCKFVCPHCGQSSIPVFCRDLDAVTEAETVAYIDQFRE